MKEYGLSDEELKALGEKNSSKRKKSIVGWKVRA